MDFLAFVDGRRSLQSAREYRLLSAGYPLAPLARPARHARGSNDGHAFSVHVIELLLPHLPPQAQALCACVQYSWRFKLQGVDCGPLFRSFDMRPHSAFARPLSDACLRSVATLARKGMVDLVVHPGASADAIKEACEKNCKRLETIHGVGTLSVVQALKILGAAPTLKVVQIDALVLQGALAPAARQLTQNAHRLRARRVLVAEKQWLTHVAALFPAVHASRLEIACWGYHAAWPEALDAMAQVSTFLELGLYGDFGSAGVGCVVYGLENIAALVRLLSRPDCPVQRLDIMACGGDHAAWHNVGDLMDSPDEAEIVAGALRLNRSLTHVQLESSTGACAAALVRGVAGHASVQKLVVIRDRMQSTGDYHFFDHTRPLVFAVCDVLSAGSDALREVDATGVTACGMSLRLIMDHMLRGNHRVARFTVAGDEVRADDVMRMLFILRDPTNTVECITRSSPSWALLPSEARGADRELAAVREQLFYPSAHYLPWTLTAAAADSAAAFMLGRNNDYRTGAAGDVTWLAK